MTDTDILKVPDSVRAAFAPIRAAVGPVRRELAATADVLAVRPGYAYPANGSLVPTVVVAVTPGTAPVDPSQLEARFKVPFVVTDATVDEQIAAAAPVAFAAPPVSAFEAMLSDEPGLVTMVPPKTGSYLEPDSPRLTPVIEHMQLTICVSPEAGWSELENFLSGTGKSLTVAMYQFTAPHIFTAISNAVTPSGRTFELVLHPVPEKPSKTGVKANDLDERKEVLQPLEHAMKSRFDLAWATLVSGRNPDGLWASAYHIKVAVRDSEAIWLSSGNWQSSNQPDLHLFGAQASAPPAGFQRKYNRDYHAIAVNRKLAEIYEFYIARDFKLAAAQAGAATSFTAPDLFVPEEEPEEPVQFAPPVFFRPLRLDRVVSVQPLLSPDNYSEHALALIRSAKKNIRFQNQYITFKGTSEDFNEFRLLVAALKDKIDAGLDVKIICRDMMKEESLDILVALEFPRANFRFQPACHNKTIIVDDEVALFGSHNWSNEGVKTNRDASLIFDDKEIAAYLGEVFDYDWERLATANPTKAKPRVAKEGESAPPGMKRVPFSAVFDD
jgi:hypothetical protein